MTVTSTHKSKIFFIYIYVHKIYISINQKQYRCNGFKLYKETVKCVKYRLSYGTSLTAEVM